ncbi:MAG: hypothetical protein ACD_40C00053G0012 [uncultured bacterium]|nr:MAG: hypothetical protein ACD_40C00053G0012 [uncultured bacterium]KKU15135.1 MAG: hypothetical protein UX21_C0006G0028 [Microgenomates group bacterium GW2011_GWC2_45_8]KKU26341.1 MAG: hypothetical protein UX37_C0003G0027 [Microgenomates group bacterium GW2011_GWA2_46_16]
MSYSCFCTDPLARTMVGVPVAKENGYVISIVNLEGPLELGDGQGNLEECLTNETIVAFITQLREKHHPALAQATLGFCANCTSNVAFSVVAEKK